MTKRGPPTKPAKRIKKSSYAELYVLARKLQGKEPEADVLAHAERLDSHSATLRADRRASVAISNMWLEGR